MSILEAEGIVLRQYSLGEADRIVVFFTRERGKLRGAAAGAKRPKSRLGACLEPLNHIRIEYLLREGADLARIRQCELLHSFLGKNPSLMDVYCCSYLAEIVNELSQENLENPLLFRLFLTVLRAGETLGMSAALLRYFEVWSLKLNGILPDYAYCSDCGKYVKDVGFFALPETGVCRCGDCARSSGVRVRPGASRVLTRILRESPERFAKCAPIEDEIQDLKGLAQRLLTQHIEKPLKSFQELEDFIQHP